MRTEADELAKQVLLQALSDRGETVLEQVVSAPDPQRIDVWHVPAPAPAPWPPHLQLLGRMAVRHCLIEPFSRPPSVSLVRDNLRKQLVWHHKLCLEARAKERPAPELPYLWILSPGRPESLLETFAAARLPGWPDGFYQLGQGLEIGLLLLSDLPQGPETLVLRLMGSRKTRREAIAELSLLSAQEPSSFALRRFLVCLQHVVAHDTNIPVEEREDFMTTAQAEFLKYERELLERGTERGIERGLERGLAMGLRDWVRDTCEGLSIELTPARLAQLEELDVQGLRALLSQLKKHRSWE